jgi:hypothetical protein
MKYSVNLFSNIVPVIDSFLVFFIMDFFFADCPAGVEAGDTCEEVTVSIVLMFEPTEEDPMGAAAYFHVVMEEAILEGQLQQLLNCSEIYILDQSVVGTPVPTSDGGSVSAGGIAGAVIGSLAVIAIAAYLVNRRGEDKEELEELAPAPKDSAFDEGEEGGDNIKPTSAVVTHSGELAAVKKVQEEDKDVNVVETMSNPDDASSSNAGSSGWSSSAGISSMNTGSAEGLDLDKHDVGGIGPALDDLNQRAVASELQDPTPDLPSIPSVTRADLDAAIEQGDWAAGEYFFSMSLFCCAVFSVFWGF